MCFPFISDSSYERFTANASGCLSSRFIWLKIQGNLYNKLASTNDQSRFGLLKNVMADFKIYMLYLLAPIFRYWETETQLSIDRIGIIKR